MGAIAGKSGAVTFKGSGSHVFVVGVKAWEDRSQGGYTGDYRDENR